MRMSVLLCNGLSFKDLEAKMVVKKKRGKERYEREVMAKSLQKT